MFTSLLVITHTTLMTYQITALSRLYDCNNCGCCLNQTCTKDNVCTHSCIQGYWGETCENECPQICVECTRHMYEESGEIKHDCFKCVDGRYPGPLNDCQNKCPTNCQSCLLADHCTKCNPGFYNSGNINDCSLLCPENCRDCRSAENCISCKSGYFNKTTLCSERCSEKCLDCIDSEKCTSCKPGFYTVNCSVPCIENCIDGICYQTNGTCVKGCQDVDRNLNLKHCATFTENGGLSSLEILVAAEIAISAIAIVILGLFGCILALKYRRRRQHTVNVTEDLNPEFVQPNPEYYDVQLHEYIETQQIGTSNNGQYINTEIRSKVDSEEEAVYINTLVSPF